MTAAARLAEAQLDAYSRVNLDASHDAGMAVEDTPS